MSMLQDRDGAPSCGRGGLAMALKMKFALLPATICATGMSCPSTAIAQTSKEEKSATAYSDENEIVVTAIRRDTTLQTTPINISAVTGEQLENQRIDNVQALTRYTPGISMIDQGPRSPSRLVVRGLNAESTEPVVRQNESVATYLGEVPLFADFKLIDIDRVEVLRGPQGTLYGAGTLAGAVRYLPARPDAGNLSVEAHGRLYDLAHSRGVGAVGDVVINIPIVADKIAFRSATGYFRDPGFIDAPFIVRQPGVSNPQPDLSDPAAVASNLRYVHDINDERTFTTRNKLLLSPFDGLEAILTYAYQRTKTDGRQANGGGVLGTDRYQIASRLLETMDRKAQLASLEINAEIPGFAKFTSSTGYTKQDFHYIRDLTDEILGYEIGYENFPTFTAIAPQTGKVEQINQEMRLTSLGSSRFSWVVGAFLNHVTTRNQYYEFTPGLPEFLGVYRPDNLEYAARSRTKTTETAAFGELSYKLTDQWQVTGGMRYFSYQAYSEGGQSAPFVDGSVYPDINYTNPNGRTKDDGFVYKLNTSYEFSDQLFGYATYSTGYRIGGINRVPPCPVPLPTVGQITCGLPNELFYRPDKTRNLEVGIRASLADRKLSFTLAAFHIDWDDIQINGSTQYGANGITVNGSQAVSKGVEFSFTARPTRNLTLSGTYAYTDAHLTKDAPLLYRNQFDAFAGDRLPQSPRHAASFTANYVYPLADERDVALNWGITYTGDVLTTVGRRAFGERVPDYLLNQASITYRTPRWEVGLFADNIFNKFYYTDINQPADRTVAVNGFILREYGQVVGRPRTIGLEGRVRF